MSDSLEDDPGTPPAAPPTPAAPEPVSEPVVAAPVAPVEPEGVEVDGQHYAPVAAVIAERQKAQTARGERDSAQQQLAQAMQIIQNLQKPAAPPPPPAPTTDPEALLYAQKLSLYKADGSPDVETASEILNIQTTRAQRAAQQTMQPMLDQSAQQRAAANFQRVSQMKDAAGRQINTDHLRSLFSMMKPEDVADERVAATLGLIVAGAQAVSGPQVIAPQAQPPVYTEASGGHPRSRPTMSALEETIAAQRGVAPDRWKDLTKGHIQGRPSTLED